MTEGRTARPLLEASGLRVRRGEKAILRGVDVSARAGEVLGILGPSGAGKSTLFRALVGELTVESGAVLLDARDVTGEPLWQRARSGIGYLPQTPSVLWDLTVRQNLRAYHRIVNLGADRSWPEQLLLRMRALLRPPPGEESAIEDLARRVALEDRLDVRAGELSGGERRRLELARALTRSPKVLVCDEPFAGVDPQTAGRLADMLRELATERNVAVLLADHHVAEALRVCDRALLMLDGEIAIEADPDAFQAHPLVVGRYLGTWGRSHPPPVPT